MSDASWEQCPVECPVELLDTDPVVSHSDESCKIELLEQTETAPNQTCELSAEEAAPPISFRAKLIAVAAISLSESFHVNVIWSMAPFMMQDLDVPEAQIGGWVGVLSAAFFAAQLVSSPAWGALSDHFGRRPTLLVGVLGAAGSIVLLGVNHSIATNVAARALAGILNGNIAITKTYLAEICDDSNRARGFSTLAFCWGVGCIVAPALGGFLSSPADKYPNLFGGSALLVAYPFLLPCLCVAMVSCFGFIYGFFNLPETEPFLARKAAQAAQQQPIEHSVLDGEEQADGVTLLEEKAEGAGETPVEKPSGKEACSCLGEGFVWLWKSPHTLRLVFLYSILSAHALVFEELWSVFCKAPPPSSGGLSAVGLGFSTDQVGVSLMIGGLLLLPFQVLVFPAVSNRFGSWWIILACQSACIPLYLLFPTIAYIEDDVWTWVAIACAQLTKVVCYSSVFTSVTMMIGCACEGPYLGFANGVAQACSSAARMVAPLAGGWIWSYSLTLDSPMRQWLVFCTICVLVVVSNVLSVKLPRSLGRKEEADGVDKDPEEVSVPNVQLLSPRRGF